ncbi:hypothetical protein [Deinococcus sonorensis]|uniref:Uncharacterized protein n=2 Tax=Deinococcus sonorensis TaxID=309891 RepID=A0AAU7U647_9DEIO
MSEQLVYREGMKALGTVAGVVSFSLGMASLVAGDVSGSLWSLTGVTLAWYSRPDFMRR